MRIVLMMGALASLVACGGERSVSGDIGQACVDAGRRDATPQLCSCVQQVADQTLSTRDQARAVAFFDNPQLAQDTRQSDRSSDEAFWDRYKAFSELATQICRPVEIG